MIFSGWKGLQGSPHSTETQHALELKRDKEEQQQEKNPSSTTLRKALGQEEENAVKFLTLWLLL